MSSFLEVAVAAARAGGARLLALDRELLVVERKDERADLTTSADRASQDAAVVVLRGAYPDAAVVGEDGTVGDPDAEHVWYVDGLDGTANYAFGLPWFCVSVALRIAGEVIAGAVFDPVHDELYSAARGGTATCNGTPLHVSGVDRLDRALVVTQAQTSDPAVIADYVARHERLMNAAAGVRSPGAPALILSHIAAGHYTAYVERDMPAWDISAGQVILEAAGGTVTDFAGRRVASAATTDVIASNGLVHDALRAVV